MIPIKSGLRTILGAVVTAGVVTAGVALGGPSPTPASPNSQNHCLESRDGYLHAKLAGAIETTIDWPDAGTRCQGESRSDPSGVRLSFQRPGAKPDVLFVFGLSGVKRGESAHAVPTNVTVIAQGTSKIYGTQGDSRCTVDSLTQTPTKQAGAYRLEARGFCIAPAHAIRGKGAVLVNTFEFAGVVDY